MLCCHTAGSFNAIAVIHQLIGSANISIILELALDHCYQLWMLFSSIQNWCSDDTALDVIKTGFPQLSTTTCEVQNVINELQKAVTAVLSPRDSSRSS